MEMTSFTAVTTEVISTAALIMMNFTVAAETTFLTAVQVMTIFRATMVMIHIFSDAVMAMIL